jgi:hypothetical protein
MMEKKELLALDGTILNEEVYELIFNEINTYAELPLMLELAAYEVARSEFDSLKVHALTYHISGLVSVISGAKKALSQLEDEVKIIGFKLEDEMDMNEYRRYVQLKKCLEKFL